MERWRRETHIKWGGSGDIAGSVDGQGSQFQITAYTPRPLVFRQKKDATTTIVTTYIDVNGNVGIGPNFSATSLPTEKLDVDGNARIRAISYGTNNFLVTGQADGTLHKLDFTNNQSQFLRADGIWSPVLPANGAGFLKNDGSGNLSWRTTPEDSTTGSNDCDKIVQMEERIKMLEQKLETLLLASAK